MTRQNLFDVIQQAVNDRSSCIIGNHNLHSLFFYSESPDMRAFYASADYVQIDGMPLVWLGRLLGLPLAPKHRSTNIDLLPLLASAAARLQWRLFYLGSKPGIAAKGARRLQERYQGLQITTCHGYFDMDHFGEQNQRVLAQIRDYAPDILFVGMGMPRQELWIRENSKDIGACTILCCGGLMDLIAGETPTPPRWLAALGFEWLCRLLSQPGRTWNRYLVEPWVLLGRMLSGYIATGQMSIELQSRTGDETKLRR